MECYKWLCPKGNVMRKYDGTFVVTKGLSLIVNEININNGWFGIFYTTFLCVSKEEGFIFYFVNICLRKIRYFRYMKHHRMK